jgi:hypothetical protein
MWPGIVMEEQHFGISLDELDENKHLDFTVLV